MASLRLNNGQVLVEILIAIALMAIISAIVIQAGFLGGRSTTASGQQSVMVSLAQEGIEAFEAMAKSDWHAVYNLSGKGATEYYPVVSSSTAWAATTTLGYKTVSVDNVNYSRWGIIDNVSRTSGIVDKVYAAANDDPSTQKITMNVTAAGQPNVQITRYIVRARNTTATQTNWSGGAGQATNPTAGFDQDFNTQYDTGTDADTGTAGSIKILAQ